MKIKRILALTLAAGMLFTASAGAKSIEFTIDKNDLYVNDKGIIQSTIEAAPYIEKGRTMVPVRVISEQFGAYVSWHGGRNEVSITANGVDITLSIGGDKAYVNGELVPLDVPATIVNGRTMVPLRFISEALGRNVEYVDLTKQIMITDEKPVVEINGEKIYKEELRFIKDFYIQVNGISDEAFAKFIVDYIKEYVVMAQKAEKENFAISEEDKTAIVAECVEVGDIIHMSTFVSSAAKMLERSTLATYYLLKYDFGITEQEIEKLYKDNYICAKHILLLTCDPVTRAELSKEEKNEANAKAAYALRKLKSGVSFDDVMKEFGQDPGVEYNTDGYVFKKGDMIPEFENAAFSLRSGEMTSIVESSLGYHIIKRVELPKISEELKGELYNQLSSEKYAALLEEEFAKADIQVNYTPEEIMNLLK